MKNKKLDFPRSPDWSGLLKELKTGRKLKHVDCNDRSAPVVPKCEGQFVYVFETINSQGPDRHRLTEHNLMKDIQLGANKPRKAKTNDKNKQYYEAKPPEKMKKFASGLRCRPRRLPDCPGTTKEVESSWKLGHVECNDRSPPVTSGTKSKVSALRQLFDTKAEKIQNSVTKAHVVDVATKPDELDDIHEVRYDLQSAKKTMDLVLRIEKSSEGALGKVTNLQEVLNCDKPASTTGPTRSADTDQQLINKHKIPNASEADHPRELKPTRSRREVAQPPIPPKMSVMPSVEHLSGGEEEDADEDDDESSNDGSKGESKAMKTAKILKLKIMKLVAVREGQTSVLVELAKTQKKLKSQKKKYKMLHKELDNLLGVTRDDDDEGHEWRRRKIRGRGSSERTGSTADELYSLHS